MSEINEQELKANQTLGKERTPEIIEEKAQILQGEKEYSNKGLANSATFKWVSLILAEIILLALVFSLGIRVGVRKASFSAAFGANYERNFVGAARGPRSMMDRPPLGPPMERVGRADFFQWQSGGEMRNTSGIAGTIVSINGNNIIVNDSLSKENNVAVNDQTLIKFRGEDLKITDLKNGQRIVAIGKPSSDGIIAAELIRVFDININK